MMTRTKLAWAMAAGVGVLGLGAIGGCERREPLGTEAEQGTTYEGAQPEQGGYEGTTPGATEQQQGTQGIGTTGTTGATGTTGTTGTEPLDQPSGGMPQPGAGGQETGEQEQGAGTGGTMP